MAQTMARPGALVEVMQGLAAQAAQMLGRQIATAVLLDTDGRARVVAATHGPVAGLVTVELAIGEGPTLEALRGDVVVFEDVDEQRWPHYGAQAREVGVRGVIAVPLRGGERPLGALTVMATEPHHWHVTDVVAAEALADLAGAYAAQHSELERVRRTADQLQEALTSRVIIEQAKGVLVGELGCTVERAYRLLRDHARGNNATLQSVAHAVVHLGLRPPTRGPGVLPAAGRPGTRADTRGGL